MSPDDLRQRRDDANDVPNVANRSNAPGRATTTSRLSPSAGAVAAQVMRLMRKAAHADEGVTAGAEQSVASAASSSGQPLPDDVRGRFEGSLGADLSGVRVHTGGASADAAGAVGARAYTTGQDIHFATGQYAPKDPFGLHLLAHEVAHTVQQSGGAAPSGAPQYKLEVSSPGDAHEVEADRAADAMVAGQSVQVSGASTAVQRDQDPAKRIAAAKSRFDSIKLQASVKFGDIATQQVPVAQAMKEAALKEDPPSMAAELLAAIAGAAISAVAGKLGAAIAAKVAKVAVQALSAEAAHNAVESAFAKGGDFAKDVATGQIKKVDHDAPRAETYFNLIGMTYGALAGHHSDAFIDRMTTLWESAESDPQRAEEACTVAEAARDGLQAGLDQQAFVTETQNAAFSGWSNILSHGNKGGVMFLELTVAEHGLASGEGSFHEATIRGMSSELVAVVTDRPLSSFTMPMFITANYFAARPGAGVGADGSEGEGQFENHTFTIKVTEARHVTAEAPDPWLVDMGHGDADAGARALFAALQSWSVPLKAA